MTKDVWVSIEGLQNINDSEGEKIEVITPGNYYFKKGHHYILYEEIMEEEGIVSKNTLRIDGNKVSIKKRGDVNVDMIFEENKRNVTNYVTTYGTLIVGFEANKIKVDELEDVIKINIEYSLSVNYEHLYNCVMNMTIKSKTEDISLIS